VRYMHKAAMPVGCNHTTLGGRTTTDIGSAGGGRMQSGKSWSYGCDPSVMLYTCDRALNRLWAV
jgi:hypothetical protein